MSSFEQKSVSSSKNRTVHLVTTIAVAKALSLPMDMAEGFCETLTPVGSLGGQPAFDRADMLYRANERLGERRDWPTVSRIAIATKIKAGALGCEISSVGVLGAINRDTRLPKPTLCRLLAHLARKGMVPEAIDFSGLMYEANVMFSKAGVGKTHLSSAELATCLRLTRAPAVLRGRRSFICFYDKAKCLEIIFNFFAAKQEQDSTWVSFDHLMELKKVSGKELSEIAKRVTKRNVGITHLVSPLHYNLIKAAVESWTAKRSENVIKTQ
jgi:hypothetical protein